MNKRYIVKCITAVKILVGLASIASLAACGGGAGADSQTPDPTVAQLPTAYVKRPVPTDTNGAPASGDVRDLEAFNPGAHLIVKMSTSLSAQEIDVTQDIIGNDGDVRDPEFSPDGSKLVFALHKKNNPNDTPPVYWDIYVYDLTQPLGSSNPKQLTTDTNSLIASNDIEPKFIPGNRIIFTSTRAEQTKYTLVDEGNPQFSPVTEDLDRKKHAFNLHSMAEDGSDMKQLTFNMSDDLYPTVIRSIPGLEGRILFVRWEHNPSPVYNKNDQRSQMSLYTMNPDGTDVQLLYGEHSHLTGTNNTDVEFTQPRETEDGNLMVLARQFTGTFDGGAPMLIDVSQYVDNNIPVSAGSGLGGPAQSWVSTNPVLTIPGISTGGLFSSVFPLLDGTNRTMVSYSLCYVNVDTGSSTQVRPCNFPNINLSDPNTTVAPPRYGIFLYNISDNTMLPITVPQDGYYYTDVAVAQNISEAPYIADNVDISSKTGYLDIRSVYDMDGSFDWTPNSLFSTTDLATINTSVTNYCAANPSECATPAARDYLKIKYLADPVNATGDSTQFPTEIDRPARFLRIVKGVYLPDSGTKFSNSAYGVSSSQFMRQIIGYAPIEPDGSVRVKVPANVPLSISILDKNGRRIGNRHGAWLTVRPGETLTCNGCHNPDSTVPHGRKAALFPSINPGAPYTGYVFLHSTGIPVNEGDTMAEARTRIKTTTNSTPADPKADIVYTDDWTDPATAGRAIDNPFSYSYASLATPSPANSCDPWGDACRITINYEADIQPIWDLSTRTDVAGNPQVCTSCHHAPDGTNPPDGQLDLTSSSKSNNRLVSYQDLLRTHNEVDKDGNVVLVDTGTTDANGDPIFKTVPIPRSVVAGSALASTNFFGEFTSGNNKGTAHCTNDTNSVCQPWLSPSELKLLSEWFDIGAQYYNNPFLAP